MYGNPADVMDRYLNVTEARQGLLELVEQIEGPDRIVITKRGKPRAVLVNFEQFKLLEDVAWLFQDPRRRAAMQGSWEAMQRGELFRLPAGQAPSVKNLLALAKRALRPKRRRA
jgi:prevent-host-death family protein